MVRPRRQGIFGAKKRVVGSGKAIMGEKNAASDLTGCFGEFKSKCRCRPRACGREKLCADDDNLRKREKIAVAAPIQSFREKIAMVQRRFSRFH